MERAAFESNTFFLCKMMKSSFLSLRTLVLIVFFMGTLIHIVTVNISQQQQQRYDDDNPLNQPPTKESFTASSQKRKQSRQYQRKRTRRKNNDIIDDNVTTTSTTTTTSSSSSPLICYVSQGHAKRYERILRRLDYAANHDGGNTYRFYFHSYDKECDGCLFQYKTTPAEGRNLAVKAAVTSPDWSRCRYLVVFDDDVYLLHDDNQPAQSIEIGRKDDTRTLDSWKDLHQMLLRNTTTYPIIVPQTPFDFPSKEVHHTYQSCVDEVFWMIRSDIVDFFYPFSNLAGTTNYWMTNVATFYVMEKCWPAGIWVDYRWKAYNPKHRYDISKSSHYWNATWQKQILIEMLNRDFDEIGPWNQTNLNRPDQLGYKPIHNNNTLLIHRCHVETSPPKQPNIIDPKCRDLAKRRFQKWIHGDYIP